MTAGFSLANLVSIVIPTRNRAALLGQALRTARRQTWDSREIVGVDEAADDDTPAMLARDFPEVRVIRHDTPRGPAGARNAGVAAAKGDWVFFWDDDDLMHPGHLEALVQAQRSAPADTLISGRVRSFIVADKEVRLSPIIVTPAERPVMATLEEFIQPHRRGTLTLSTILWPAALCRAVPWDEKLFINEVSGVDAPANLIPGWMIRKAAGNVDAAVDALVADVESVRKQLADVIELACAEVPDVPEEQVAAWVLKHYPYPKAVALVAALEQL